MTIEKIKEFVTFNKDKTLNFKYNGARNQTFEFSGVIVSIYPSVFTVKQEDLNLLRSFTYADVLIGSLEIK